MFKGLRAVPGGLHRSSTATAALLRPAERELPCDVLTDVYCCLPLCRLLPPCTCTAFVCLSACLPACCLPAVAVSVCNPDVDISFATMGAGSLQLLPLTQLVAALKTACPVADTYSAAPVSFAPPPAAVGGGGSSAAAAAGSGGTGGSSNALSMAAHNKFIENFPGPLNSATSKDKVLKFLKDRLTHYVQEEGLVDAPSWQVKSSSSGRGPGGDATCVAMHVGSSRMPGSWSS